MDGDLPQATRQKASENLSKSESSIITWRRHLLRESVLSNEWILNGSVITLKVNAVVCLEEYLCSAKAMSASAFDLSPLETVDAFTTKSDQQEV
jgi:hypothetical protein